MRTSTFFILTRLIEVALISAILMLAAALRLTNQPDNPGWYSDETTHIDIARHLLNGETRYFAIQDSVLIFGRPPLFGATLTAFMRLNPQLDGIAALRLLTGALGVLTVALLYVAARVASAGDWPLALSAAFALAIYPQAVTYSRIGYSYALLAPFFMLALMGLAVYWRNGRRVWLALACLAVGVGLTSDLMIGGLIPVIMLVILFKRRPLDLLWGLPLVALPFGAWATSQMLQHADVFLFDLRYTLGRLSTPSLTGQAENIARNVTILVGGDGWLAAGVIGLFLLRDVRFRATALLMLIVPVIVIGRVVALYSLSYYYVTPLLPLVALGMGAVARYGAVTVVGMMTGKQTSPPDPLSENREGELTPLRRDEACLIRVLKSGFAWIVAIVLIGVVPLTTLNSTWEAVQTRLPTAIDPFLIDPAAARGVRDYLEANANDGDLVIASPPIGWQLRDSINAADYQMSIAAEGVAGPHLPGDIPPERFAFDPRFERARFVVVDPLWRSWGVVHIPGLGAKLAEIEQSWGLAFAAGEGGGALLVYQRP